MKRILSMLAAAIACTAAGAQTIDDILGQVGKNNLTLKALQQQLDAGADANLAEARLEGPEVEFGYLFGEDGRRRHDFGVSQSFDFGALTGARKRLALGQNELLALEYRTSRRDILTQARKLVYRIVNCNALIAEYTRRADNARAVEQAYRSGYEKGEFSVIDYRKAAVGLAEAEGTLRLCEVERDGLLAELKNLRTQGRNRHLRRYACCGNAGRRQILFSARDCHPFQKQRQCRAKPALRLVQTKQRQC